MNIIKICFDRLKRILKSSIGSVLVLLLGMPAAALAGITLSNTAITGDSSFANITGVASMVLDLGAGNTLSLQTTNNGPITTGSGLVTIGGNFLVNGTSSLSTSSIASLRVTGTSTLSGISDIVNIDRSGTISIGTSSATTITLGRSGQTLNINSSLSAVTSTVTALTVGSGGTNISKHFSTTSSLTFGVIASTTCASLSAAVSGANATDTVIATPTPVASGIDTVSTTWVAWISGTGTSTVRACNPTFSNTASVAAQTWRFDVWQH